MDLEKLLDMQKKLDKAILDNPGIKEYSLENIKLALLVEVGELANEVKCFKYWEENKEINRERVLDEFADCLYFALSLENELHQIDNFQNFNVEEIVLKVKELEESFGKPSDHEVNIRFIKVYEKILVGDEILKTIIAIGIFLGFDANEMEKIYIVKNKINYQRQQEGY